MLQLVSIKKQICAEANVNVKEKLVKEENQRKEEYNLETTLLIEPDNEEALLMLMKIALEKSNYEKVKDLSEKFVKVCKNLCDENKDIQESLKNIEPENNES